MKLFSEKMSHTGTINLDAIQKLFTITELDDISVFIRETAQNSWDARIKLPGKYGAGIDLQYLVKKITGSQEKSFDKTFFLDASHEIKNKLNQFTREGQSYLIVHDKGTIGLAGPTLATEKGADNNYVSFLLNIGQEHTDATTGGAFGFGKSVFFRASKPKTILIYTRTKNAAGSIESRFIGVTLHKKSGDIEFTGRHWWCEPSKIGGVDIPRPIIGSEADKLGELLGIKTYESKETGTAIAIIGPEFDNLKRDSDQNLDSKLLVECLAEAANFWYWPRMEGGGLNDGKIRFKVWHDNDAVEPFNFCETTPFIAFKNCLLAIQKAIATDGNSGVTNNNFQQFHEIKYQYNRVGYLCLTKTVRSDRPIFKSRIINPETNNPINHPLSSMLWKSGAEEPSCRHIALIRGPGQVIQYLRQPECSDSMMEYAGVFYLHPSEGSGGAFLDSFKKAEPAAHDKWEYNNTGVVSNTVSKIKDLVREFARPENRAISSSASGLGSVSTSLASLWSYGEGSGGIAFKKSKPKPRDAEKSKIIVRPARLFAIDGINYVSIHFIAPQLEGWSRIVKSNVKSLLYGGGNDDVATDEEGSPRLIGWYEAEPSSGSQESITKMALSNDIIFTIPQSFEGKTICALFLAPSKYWAEFNILQING